MSTELRVLRKLMVSPSHSRWFVLLFTLPMAVLGGCEKKRDPKSEVVAKDLSPKVIASASSTRTGAGKTNANANVLIDAGTTALETIEVPEVRVRSNEATTVRVVWIMPKGTAVNDEAPFRVQWNRSDGLSEAPPDVKSTGRDVKDGLRVKVRPMNGAPNASLTGEIHIVICDAVTHSVCVPVRRAVELGFVVAKDAAEETSVSIPLPEARVTTN